MDLGDPKVRGQLDVKGGLALRDPRSVSRRANDTAVQPEPQEAAETRKREGNVCSTTTREGIFDSQGTAEFGESLNETFM